MQKFYDFLFYLIYKFYAGKEKGAASSSAGIVGGLQAMNLLTIFMILLFYAQRTPYLSKLFAVIVAIFFQVTTYIRYIYKENNSIEKMDERWSALSESKRERIWTLSLIYISLSVILFFGVAGYIGSKR